MKFAFFTIKTVLKDRIFLMISSLILVYAFIPVFSYFSMRQLQEVSITMSITLNSFILLVLSIFGSIYTIWRDIERKYTFTLLSYPTSRINYIFGRYFGFVSILLIITVVNLILGVIAIKISASFYKSDLPILWSSIALSYIFCWLKYSLILAVGFFFASFSTSFFTPIFSTIAIYLSGNSIQGIYEYVAKDGGNISAFVKKLVSIIYYILPNLSAFDFTASAVYSLKIDLQSVFYTFVYFILYFTILFGLTCVIFNKRDLT